MNRTEGHWLLDQGNTRLKLARIVGGNAVFQGAWPSGGEGMRELVQAMGSIPDGAAVAWLAASAGETRRAELQSALQAVGHAVRIARCHAQCGRLRIAYADPARLGVDRFLALLAASEQDDGPNLVVSAGSALTVDLLAADGGHAGGLIALSPALHRQALAERIPHLDVPGGQALDFARDTGDAMASGAAASALGLVERSLRLAQARLGHRPRLVLTGGGAKELLPQLPGDTVHCPALVLDGLARYARSFASLPA